MSSQPPRHTGVIGGGPAGLTAALYLARAFLAPLVFIGETNKDGTSGGQLMSTTEVENFPGFPEGIDGPTLIDLMTRQALRFGAKMIEQRVERIELGEGASWDGGGPFILRTGDGASHIVDAVIVASGASARFLGLANEDRLRNHGISACATCDGPLPMFRNQHLVVVGGGDSAMEEANFLTRFASRVTIVHRRGELRASKIMQQHARNNAKIAFALHSVVHEYLGEHKLQGVAIRDVRDGRISALDDVAGVFIAVGHDPMTHFLRDTPIQLHPGTGYLQVHDNVHTSCPGIFAAGDVHDAHYRQAITAAGFGCMAALAAERWLSSRI